MLRPSFIIADEPVSMLDAQVRKTFLDLLIDFHDRYGMTTLFITHDLSRRGRGRIADAGGPGDELAVRGQVAVEVLEQAWSELHRRRGDG